MSKGNAATGAAWFKRHPLLALLAFNVVVFGTIALVAEITLRLVVSYNPGFYTAVSVKGRELVHPYGVIKINSDGYPDDEFDLDHPHKVGYFGDSVTYGVGAGYPYRISEILEKAYPGYEHMNISGIGLSISAGEIDWASRLAQHYGMEKVIYLFNLNDILPTASASGKPASRAIALRNRVIDTLDWLRGRSYLYTALRNQVKQALLRAGYGFHGYTAYEFFPDKNESVLRETAERINLFHDTLAKQGIELVVVILPYEMQISSEAEATYASKGVHWAPAFIERETQQVVMDALDPAIPVFDAYWAFVDARDPAGSRARNGLGEYFVYDKGDKLDWNHPNRAGHRAIAEYLIAEHILGQPGALARQEVSGGPAPRP